MKTKSRKLSAENLESRICFSLVGFEPEPIAKGISREYGMNGYTLIIDGTTGADTVSVANKSSGLNVTRNGTTTFIANRSQYKSISFSGGKGADKFTSSASISVYADGGEGADTLVGGSGNDVLLGGSGADTLRGNGGEDRLEGGTENDKLYGGSDNDRLYGGAGNDRLFGEGGADTLWGDAGNDGLVGGAGAADWLYGGTGNDRLLVNDGDKDTLYRRESGDALMTFENGKLSWSNSELEAADDAFLKLQDRLNGKTTLLKDPVTGDLRFTNTNLPGNTSGRNTFTPAVHESGSYWDWEKFNWVNWKVDRSAFRKIEIDDHSSNAGLMDTIIHEIGHNWDEQSEINLVTSKLKSWEKDFNAISKWSATKTSTSPNASLDKDDSWFYAGTTKDFARAYGKNNRYDDISTIWEHYFNGNRNSSSNSTAVKNKIKALDSLFAALD